MPKVNLAGVKTTFELVPDGDYEAIFTKFENVKNKSGENAVNQTYTITKEGEWKGRKLFKRYTLSEAALWSWKGDAIAMGADAEALEQEVDTDDVLKELLNNSIKIRVGHHSDPDNPEKMYNDVEVLSDNSW